MEAWASPSSSFLWQLKWQYFFFSIYIVYHLLLLSRSSFYSLCYRAFIEDIRVVFEVLVGQSKYIKVYCKNCNVNWWNYCSSSGTRAQGHRLWKKNKEKNKIVIKMRKKIAKKRKTKKGISSVAFFSWRHSGNVAPLKYPLKRWCHEPSPHQWT